MGGHGILYFEEKTPTISFLWLREMRSVPGSSHVSSTIPRLYWSIICSGKDGSVESMYRLHGPTQSEYDRQCQWYYICNLGEYNSNRATNCIIIDIQSSSQSPLVTLIETYNHEISQLTVPGLYISYITFSAPFRCLFAELSDTMMGEKNSASQLAEISCHLLRSMTCACDSTVHDSSRLPWCWKRSCTK